MIVDVVAAVLSFGAVYLLAGARVVKQYERGLVFRLGRLRSEVRPPGFKLVVPGVDRLVKVNMQIVTLPIPSQEGITRDNVTVRVDAVVYFKVIHPVDAVINVEDYRFAVLQVAQTSLRSIIGKSDLDDLLSNREKLNEGLALMIDSPALGWGVQIDRVEIKDVSLPESMKRSMARQAEAARDRRARVINADAELQASRKLAEAAAAMAHEPAALQLRLLQTVTAVAAEKNSTLVLPFPVELLRFLERAAQNQPLQQQEPPAPARGPAPADAVAPAAEDTDPALNADPAQGADPALGTDLGPGPFLDPALGDPALRESTDPAAAALGPAPGEGDEDGAGPGEGLGAFEDVPELRDPVDPVNPVNPVEPQEPPGTGPSAPPVPPPDPLPPVDPADRTDPVTGRPPEA
ncbi:SPFH domain-containing protein [Streptomyces sp. PTM05]|uniref:SPFH domain-containing protein n=1 Tax=Streptantibioticus parmotrematis TaxID=2873249 RepID=A0ABS7QN62_9ACTN|nr:SPFH domain-containing protein [Streptantibioticus parmotrematis]MBY8884618.1 SPFH domain-containing protein [Streptantibioticus parmotrematis]